MKRPSYTNLKANQQRSSQVRYTLAYRFSLWLTTLTLPQVLHCAWVFIACLFVYAVTQFNPLAEGVALVLVWTITPFEIAYILFRIFWRP